MCPFTDFGLIVICHHCHVFYAYNYFTYVRNYLCKFYVNTVYVTITRAYVRIRTVSIACMCG